MTAVQSSPRGAAAAHPGLHPAVAALRVAWLYSVSRRVPGALGLITGLSALLWVALDYGWNIAGGAAAQYILPLTMLTGAAAVIAVSTYGPFGEPERATGRWLPWLRLFSVVLLTGTGFGLLAAGATGGSLPGGTLALLRDFAGTTGLGLLSSAALGGAFGWAGPMAYLLITEVALTGNPTTPWVWAARPPHDFGGAVCATLVIVAGVVAITFRGSRGPVLFPRLWSGPDAG